MLWSCLTYHPIPRVCGFLIDNKGCGNIYVFTIWRSLLNFIHNTMYIKGFKVSREKISHTFDLKGGISDPQVDLYIMPIIKHMLNRDGFKYFGSVLTTSDGNDWVEMVLVLDDGYSREELQQKGLGAIDESIQRALPYALDGPGIWERWD